VRRFIEKASFEADYTFAIGTYGSLPGAAMLNLQKQAKRKGYSFSYTNQLLMLDNYLPVFDIDKQASKLPKKQVSTKLSQIHADINSHKQMEIGAHPGKRAMIAIFRRTFKPDRNALKYTVNEKCNRCSVCAQVCPAKNIAVNEKIIFSEHCEGCLACLHLCPQNAIHLKNEKSNTRWRNPEVSLGEIIQANNRREANYHE